MARDNIVINYKICMACGVCVQACPFSYLELSQDIGDPYRKIYPQLSSGEKCNGCGICADACPLECLTAHKPDRKNRSAPAQNEGP